MKAKLDKLEMLRGFAAAYVFAGHFLLGRYLAKGSAGGFLLRFGQEAVMLFFIISGFVVYYSTAKHGDVSFGPYFARRARRIFPIFLLALGISFVTIYGAGHAEGPPFSPRQLLGNVFMLQDFAEGKPGVWVQPFGGNLALWSLSYEWWFYMLFFPIYRWVPAQRQLHVVAGLSALGFASFALVPNQASLFLMYFVLWWSGAELARSYLSREPLTFASQRRSIFYLILFSGFAGAFILAALVKHQPVSFGIHPILEFRHFSACLLFLVSGLAWARAEWIGFRSLFGAFVFIAPISYALYVFHFPLAVGSTFLDGVPFLPLQAAGYLAITFLAAYLAEVPFQNWVNRRTAGFTSRRDAVKANGPGETLAADVPPSSAVSVAPPA